MSLELYIMRHGETHWNRLNKIQGQKDIELNKTGIAQAENAKEEFNKYEFDLIICSPLKRAKQTAEIINKDKKIEIIYDKAIIERDLGDFEGIDTEVDEEKLYNYKLNIKTNNIEPILEVCNRVYKLLNYIKENINNKKVLLVTHGGTSRVISSYFYGINDDGTLPPEDLKNCEFRKYL